MSETRWGIDEYELATQGPTSHHFETVAGKLVQRSWQDDSDNKCYGVEIRVTHVGPDLQFATAEVTKSTAEG